MCHTDYLHFLIAAHSDLDLRAHLRRASAALRTLDDLAAFGARHGYAFGAADIPVGRPPAEPHPVIRTAPASPAP